MWNKQLKSEEKADGGLELNKDGGLELLRSQGKRVALRFAFRVKPSDRFVYKNVKVAPTPKGDDGFGVRGHPADC